MVDNAWRDSFQIKAPKHRIAREEDHKAIEQEDNSSLLELERRTNQAKPTGGDGLFAGTSFETPTPAPATNLIKSGLTISAQSAQNDDLAEDAEESARHDSQEEEMVGGKKESKRVTIINRATAVLEDFAERLGSSGGAIPYRRKNSKEGRDDSEREKSTDADRRKSTTPAKQRVKSVVAKLSKATSRRKTKHLAEGEAFDPEADTDPDSMYTSENPQFANKSNAAGAEGILEED